MSSSHTQTGASLGDVPPSNGKPVAQIAGDLVLEEKRSHLYRRLTNQSTTKQGEAK